MNLKNISLNKIIAIIENMTYSDVKHTKGLAQKPLQVELCSANYDTWDYEVFFESRMFNPKWDITSVRIALFDSNFKEYSQNNYIKVMFQENRAILLAHIDGKRVQIKEYKRNIKKFKEILYKKMREETIKAQKRKSMNQRKQKLKDNNFIDNVSVFFG